MSSILYTPDNPVFSAYLFYCAILVLKVLLMAPLTGRHRFAKRIFANPEDKLPKSVVKYDDPDIERVRRAHLNDLENIPVFMVAALLYIATNPSYWLALTVFRVFTVARIVHTIVYAVVVVPQPARAIAWGVGYAATIYLAVQVILFSL